MGLLNVIKPKSSLLKQKDEDEKKQQETQNQQTQNPTQNQQTQKPTQSQQSNLPDNWNKVTTYSKEAWEEKKLADSLNSKKASAVYDYVIGGNYTSGENEYWKGRLNKEIEQLTEGRAAYSSGSKKYKEYTSQINYYNDVINELTRINVGTNGVEFVNSDSWYTPEDFASQKTVVSEAIAQISSERDALDESAADYQNQYDNLTAYLDYYGEIADALDEKEKYYSQFKSIDDYTAFDKRDDWVYQSNISNTYESLQREKDELEPLLAGAAVFNGGLFSDERKELIEKYGSVKAAKEKLDEIDGKIDSLRPQYERATKYRDWQIYDNYREETNDFSLDGYDYEAKVGSLEAALGKATNDADRAAIQAQIDVLQHYADMQVAEKTDVKSLQATANALQDEIFGIKRERDEILNRLGNLPMSDKEREKDEARLKELDAKEKENSLLLYGNSGGDDNGVFEDGSLRGQIQAALSLQKQANQIRFRDNPNSKATGARVIAAEGKKHVRVQPGNAGGSRLQYQTSDGKWHDVEGSGAGDLLRTMALGDKQYDKEAYTTEDGYEYTSEEAKADAEARLEEFYTMVGNTYLGKENANGSTVEDYLDYLNDFENQSAAERFNRTVDTWGEDADGALGKAIGKTARWATEAFAVPLAAGIESGITNPVQGVKALFGTDDDPKLMRQTMLNAISNASMQDLDTRHGNENFLGTGRSASQLVFEAAQTSGNMLPAMGLAALTAGMSSALGMGAKAVGIMQKAAMSGLMGLGSAGSTYQQTVNQGYSVEDAKLFSALMGLSEAASEYWVGGVTGTMGVGEEQLMKAASGITGALPRFVAEMGVHIGSEALEEYAQNKVEPLLKNIFLSQDNDIALFDQDDWYTVLVTTLSTGAMETVPTYRNTFKANKIGKERYAELSKTIQSKAQLENKAKADQAVADAGEMLAGSKGVVRAMQEIADFFVPEGENGKAFSEEMQEMAKGLVNKKGKVNNINLGRMYSTLCNAIGTEQAGVLLSAAALKAGTILKAQDRVNQKQAAVDAVLANNPGAVVLSEQESLLKNAGLNLQAAQTGAVILGKVMDGTDLTADELALVAGESKTGKAIRAVLAAANPTITVSTKGDKAKTAVQELVKQNASIAEANAAAEGQEIVNAGVKAADQNEVLKAKQKAYSPSAATELFNAENELAGAQEALKSVEGASLDRTVRAEAIGLNEAMTGNLMDLAGADKALKSINAAISGVDAEIKALEGDGKQVLSKAKQARLAELRNEKKSLLEQKKNIQSRAAEIRAEEETKLKAKEKPVATADVSGYNEFTDPATGIRMTRADYVADMVKQGLTEEEANKRFNDLLKQAGVKVEGANANEQKSGSDRTGRTPDVGGRENGGENSERGDRSEQTADSGRRAGDGGLLESSYVDDALPEEIGRVKNGGRVLDTQEILGDGDLAEVYRELQDLGIANVYFVDGLRNANGMPVCGIFDPGSRSIALNMQADTRNQAQHEEGHAFVEAIRTALGEDGANKFVTSCLEEILDEETYKKLVRAYWPAYKNAYGLSGAELQYAINEETFTDIFGGVNRFGLDQDVYKNELRALVESADVFNFAKNVYAGKDTGEMNDEFRRLTERQLTQPFNAAVEGVDAVNDASGGILNFRGQKESVALEKTAQPKQVTIVTASDTRAQRTETDSSVREIRNEVMRDRGFSEADIKFVNDFFDDFGKVMERLGVKYEYVGLADVENAMIQVNPITGQITLSAMVNNGEYPVNFDFTKVCKKREALTEVMDYLAALKGQDNGDGTFTEVNLSPENIRAISDILTTKYGIETNCLGCFVETKRAKIQHSYEDQVIHDWNKLVDELNPGADYFNFSKGQLDLTSIPDSEFEALEKEIKAIQEKEDFIDKENARIDRENKKREKMGLPKLPKISRPKAALDKAREYLTASPSSAKKLTFADLVIPEARTRLVRDYPFIESYIAARLGTSAPKSTEVFAPYNAEIELLRYGMNGTDDDLLRYIKSIAGVRSQSFSDFIITHIYDVMQKTAGLAAKGLPAHTYTKELARAYLTGLTGEKINMSAIFDIDSSVSSWSAGLGADGKYLLTDPDAFLAGKTKYVQSVPFEKAKALQKMDGYSSNCGIIGVGYSYFHMLEMFRDDDIRQVIGYHASNMDPSLKIMTNLIQAADYTGVQNTLQIGDAEGNMFAVPLYKRPDGVPSYATPPQDATAKRDENGEYLFNKKGELQKDTASVTISKSVAYFDIKGKYAEKLQAMSPAAAAKATLSELLEYANSNGYTIITSKAEAGHGNFELYADVEATKDPRTTADNYIDYCIKQGYLPMFYEFAMEDGYYKQVFDCNMYDRNTGEYAPMNPVRLFDTDENGNRKMLLPDDFFAAVEKEMRGYNSAKKQLADNWSSIVDDVVNITDRKGKPMISTKRGQKYSLQNLEPDPTYERTIGREAKYSIISDQSLIDRLENEEYYTTYKTMQVEYQPDGSYLLYPPMNMYVNGKKVEPSRIGQWEQADESPDSIKVDAKGKESFDLRKGGKGKDGRDVLGKTTNVVYNPYIHTSNLMINDQFSEAYNRPNLVTVEVAVPKSEDNGAYRAYKAHDPTGWKKWHTGPVGSALAHTGDPAKNRRVFLSRYMKPLRIVSDAETARHYKDLVTGTDIKVPDNVVWPNLLKEMQKIGVPIEKSGKVSGAKFSLQSDMVSALKNASDAKRYQYLVDKTISVPVYETGALDRVVSSLPGETLEEKFNILKSQKTKAMKNAIKKIASALNVTGRDYTNAEVEFSFGYSNRAINESIQNQPLRGLINYAKALTVFEEIAESAVPINIRDDQYQGKTKKGSNTAAWYSLFGAYVDGEKVIPIKIDVDEQVNDNNRAHLAVAFSEIPVMENKNDQDRKYDSPPDKTSDAPVPTLVNLNIADLLRRVNTLDIELLRDIPDGFLSPEQVLGKSAGFEERERHILKKIIDKAEKNKIGKDLIDQALAEANITGDRFYAEELRPYASDALIPPPGIVQKDSVDPKSQGKFSLQEDSTTSPNNFRFSLQTPSENIEAITDKVISGTLFSGGGMVDTAVASLIHSSFAVEYDDRIQGVYLDNNDTDYMGKDVLDFDPTPYAGKLEWLHASPVCKSFSPAISENARRSREESGLDRAFAERIVKSIETIGSKIVTIEQVPRYKGTVYAEMIKQALRDNGYIFDEGVYNSADYGSATSRERYFLRAVKRGGKLPPMQKVESRRGWITAVGEEMLNSLPEAKTVNPRMLDSLKRLSGIDLNNLPEPLLVFGESYKNKEYGHAFASDPLPTIIANSGASRIFMPDGRILDCTPDVLKLISGLPAEYKLPEQLVDARTIVGNGVPVELTRAVVGSMLKANFPEKVGNTKYSLQSKSKQRADKEINIIPPKQAMEQAEQERQTRETEFKQTIKRKSELEKQFGDNEDLVRPYDEDAKVMDSAWKEAMGNARGRRRPGTAQQLSDFAADDAGYTELVRKRHDGRYEKSTNLDEMYADEGYIPEHANAYRINPTGMVTEDELATAENPTGVIHNDGTIEVFDDRLVKHASGLISPPSSRFDPTALGVKYSLQGEEISYAPTFYSQMARTVDEMKQDKIGASSVVSYLRGRGVKAEEIKWSGIEQWLEGKKSVTKGELQQFLAANELQIEEVTLENKEIPYTEEQTARIDQLESERGDIVNRLAQEWQSRLGVEFPLTRSASNLAEQATNWIMKFNTERRNATAYGKSYNRLRESLKQLAKDEDFGFDRWQDAYTHMVRNPQEFLTAYELLPEQERLLLEFVEAKDYYDAFAEDDDIPVTDSVALLDLAEEADKKRRGVTMVRSEHYTENAKHMPVWGGYKLGGGENYRELLFKLPGSRYRNDAMSVHWNKTSTEGYGILAHARLQDRKVGGKKMLFIEEVQSDWHNEGHKKGYRLSDADMEKLRAEVDEKDAALTKAFEELRSALLSKSSRERRDELEAKYEAARDELETVEDRLYFAEHRTPDAPFRDNYTDFVLKRLLRMAAEEGYDSIGWTTAQQQSDRWSDEFAEGYRIEYDQDIPKFLNKYGKKWGGKVGTATVDTGPIDEYGNPRFDGSNYTEEVWSFDIPEAMKQSVLHEGQPRFSLVDPQDIQNAINNLDLPSAGLYPPDSLESDFVKVLSEGGAKALSDYVTKVMYDYEQAQKNAQGKQTIPPKGFVPKMTKAERDAQETGIREKGKQYGFIPRKEKEVRDARLPLQMNDETKIRQHARTVKGAESINPEAVGYTNRAAMTDVQMSYTPDSNKADIRYAEKFIGSNGYEKSLGMFYGMASSTNIPTTQAIAVGEQLLIETANEEDWDNFNKVLAAVCEMGTQIGKSLQAFTLLKKSGPLGQLYYIRRAVDRLNQKTYADMIENGKMNPITIDEALARAVYTAADEDARQAAVDNLIAEVAKQVPVTLKDRWDAWRHFAMLGNVRTHMNNIVGNALFKPLLFMKDVMKAGMEGMFIRNKADRTTNIAERFGADAGGYRDFAKNDAIAMKSALQGNGKFNPANAILDARKTLGPLDSLAKKNGEWMEQEDWWFLKSAYVDSLSQILANKGIPASELYNTPEGMQALTEARKAAMIEAQKATYRDYSAVATALNNFKRIKTGKGKIAAAALEGVLPFTKTPINILARAVEYSPFEMIEIMRDIYRGAIGNPTATANEIIDKVASSLTGTGIALLGFLFAKHGVLRGKDDDDKDEAFAKLQGYQDYALVFDGPDGETHTLTLDWAAPSSLPLFTGVAAYQVLSRDEDLSFYDTLNAALMISEPMLSMSMLDGLNDVIGSASFAEDNKKLLTIAESSFESYLGQAFPTIMGQLARSLDGTRRKSYQDKNSSLPGGVQYFIQSNIQNKTPGWEEKKVPYIDQWGRTDTVQNKFLGAMENFLSPGYFSTVRTTPLDEELARLKKATAGSDLDLGSIYPPDLAGVKKFTVNGETHNMTGEEWTRFATEVGRANFDTLNDVISDPRYLRLSDEAKAKAISYFYDYNKYVGYWNIDNDYNLNGQGKWIVEAHDEPTETGRMNVIWDKIEAYLGSSSWKGN